MVRLLRQPRPRRTINGNVNRLTCSDGHTLHNSADARGKNVQGQWPQPGLLVPGDLGDLSIWDPIGPCGPLGPATPLGPAGPAGPTVVN